MSNKISDITGSSKLTTEEQRAAEYVAKYCHNKESARLEYLIELDRQKKYTEEQEKLDRILRWIFWYPLTIAGIIGFIKLMMN